MVISNGQSIQQQKLMNFGSRTSILEIHEIGAFDKVGRIDSFDKGEKGSTLGILIALTNTIIFEIF